MKSRYLKICLVLAALLSYPVAASADSLEAVTNFAQSAILSPAGTLNITDDIDYDFGGAVPHDIAYDIPLAYHDDQGRDFRISFKLQEAKLDGQTLQLHPRITTATANFMLPPGQDATTTRHYQLRYTLSPVVLSGPDADTFKHSVTGLGWGVPITRASFRFETHTAPADNVTCYTGSQGTTTSGCDVTQNGNITAVTSYAPLSPGQSLSVFSDFTRGSFQAYLAPFEAHPNTITGLIVEAILALLGIMATIMLAMFLLRRRKRKKIVPANAPDYTESNEASKDKTKHQ